MRSWRNWQTRKTKDLVGNSMQVQFLSTAPKSGIYAKWAYKCPIFFAYLIVSCGQKLVFLIKTLVFGVHFGVHISISFSLYNKSPSSTLPEELFPFMKLKFKLHQVHLICHELIGEMGVNSPNKAFRTIPHPSIYNIRSYILHTSRIGWFYSLKF